MFAIKSQICALSYYFFQTALITWTVKYKLNKKIDGKTQVENAWMMSGSDDLHRIHCPLVADGGMACWLLEVCHSASFSLLYFTV